MKGLALMVLLFLVLGGAVRAAEREAPPTLAELEAMGPGEAAALDLGFAEEKRRGAIRLAAIGYGARAGLARRSFELSRLLEGLARPLSQTYRFDALLIKTEGFTVLPPVLAETRDAFRLGRDAKRAASVRRVLAIVERERIVSAAPHWRDYLLREWPSASPPAAVLFPRDAPEEQRWRTWLAEGWAAGVSLADDIFVDDLARLNQVFEGVVRWHRLHAARIVSAPVIEVSRTPVGGGGRLLRIDEPLIRLGERAALNRDTRAWRTLMSGQAP